MDKKDFAELELDILGKLEPDAVVLEFREEILALCRAFGKSGQSGGSAPYVSLAIAQVVRKLCLGEPICEVSGYADEWEDISEWIGKKLYQNKRCGGLFRDGEGRSSYSEAIIWQEEDFGFTGSVYVDDKDFELIGSSQYVRFPFKPKKFYIDVIRVPITKGEAEARGLHYIEGFKECYYSVVKDPKDLDRVFDYYDKRILQSPRISE